MTGLDNKTAYLREPPANFFFQRPIVHPRFRAGGGGSDHQVKIMHQPSTPYHLDLQKKEEAKQKGVANSPAGGGGTGSGAGQG